MWITLDNGIKLNSSQIVEVSIPDKQRTTVIFVNTFGAKREKSFETLEERDAFLDEFYGEEYKRRELLTKIELVEKALTQLLKTKSCEKAEEVKPKKPRTSVKKKEEQNNG
jgi:hypothetical protein